MDRDAFGNWLSGFIDGEGCFFLSLTQNVRTNKSGESKVYMMPHAAFIVNLRADDADILIRLQSFLGCGLISYITNKRSKTKANPVIGFAAHNVRDLINIIVPHFRKYPLQAKKRRDFEIWAEAVTFLAESESLDKTGRKQKWTPEKLAPYADLVERLRAVREYVEPDLTGIVLGAERLQQGTRSHAAKLTEDDVRAVRASTEPANILANRYRVMPSAIRNIRNRTTWTNIE